MPTRLFSMSNNSELPKRSKNYKFTEMVEIDGVMLNVTNQFQESSASPEECPSINFTMSLIDTARLLDKT